MYKIYYLICLCLFDLVFLSVSPVSVAPALFIHLSHSYTHCIWTDVVKGRWLGIRHTLSKYSTLYTYTAVARAYFHTGIMLL